MGKCIFNTSNISWRRKTASQEYQLILVLLHYLFTKRNPVNDSTSPTYNVSLSYILYIYMYKLALLLPLFEICCNTVNCISRCLDVIQCDVDREVPSQNSPINPGQTGQARPATEEFYYKIIIRV